MAADPAPLRFVLAGHRRQQFPQIPIRNGFSAAVAPAEASPTHKVYVIPCCKYRESVIAVTRHASVRALSPLMAATSSIRLFVVCVHAPEDALVLPIPQDARPPAGAGIAQARPIREERHFLQFPRLLSSRIIGSEIAGVTLKQPSFGAP